MTPLSIARSLAGWRVYLTSNPGMALSGSLLAESLEAASGGELAMEPVAHDLRRRSVGDSVRIVDQGGRVIAMAYSQEAAR